MFSSSGSWTSCSVSVGPRAVPGIASRRATSLKPYLIEEAYEVLEAIEAGARRCASRRAGRSALPGRVPRRDRRRARRVHDGRLLARLGRQDGAPPSARVRRRTGARRRIRRSRSGKPSSSARPRRQGRRRSVIDGVPRALPVAAAGPAHAEQGRARELRLAGRARGVGEGRGGDAARQPAALAGRGPRADRRRSSGTCCSRSSTSPACRRSTPRTRCSGPSRSSAGASPTMEDDLNARGKSVASVSPEELERSWEAVEGAGAGGDEGQDRSSHRRRRARRHHRPRRSTPSSTPPTPRSP